MDYLSGAILKSLCVYIHCAVILCATMYSMLFVQSPAIRWHLVQGVPHLWPNVC